MTKEEEDLILFERKKFKKTIEEIFFSVEGVIPNIYPLKIYRCLVRYGLSVLPNELLKAKRRTRKLKNKVFKRYLFAGVDNLKEKLTDYLNLYNFEVKLRQLNYQTPANYLKERFNYLVQRILI